MHETLAEQPTAEKLKSYDPVASVRRLRFDIEQFEDGIQPETRGQVCDEELSYLVEGVKKASRTRFLLKRQNEAIVYFHEGTWRNYSGLLLTGLEAAQAEAEEDHRRAFLADRANEDWVNGNLMCGLKPSEQHAWYSSYEHDREAEYGAAFMQSCGRQPDRKMGFIYLASCQEDGQVLLESQTVDLSDADGFAAVERLASSDQAVDMDTLVAAYDTAIYEKDGVERYAGRADAERQENAWDDIQRHRDLIEYHLNTLEAIAKRDLTPPALEAAVKKHTYGVWAAFKKRIEGEASSHISGGQVYMSHLADPHLHHLLEQETQAAFNDFAQKGIVMVGCGGGFSMMMGEAGIMQASGAEVHSSIFGGDKHGKLTFTCPNGHHNRRPYGKLLTACQHKGCKAKVACK
ncbi:MAG TPA: hypothetical protein VHC21_01045 [Candidatus Saccharimonadales bacterium]|nr:hypothetical protein [Candidatus Saccharimonadales bacterium]